MQNDHSLLKTFMSGKGCLLLAIVFVISSVVVAADPIRQLVQQVSDFLNPRPTASVISNLSIISSIQPLAELVTTRVELAKINVQVRVDYGTASGCSHTAAYAVAGEFEAGVDLGELQPGAVSYDEPTNTYTLRLPGARLTDCTIRDLARYEVTGLGICPGGANRDDTQPLARFTALNDFRDEVLENGILNRAQREAQAVITNFVTALVAANSPADGKPVVRIEFAQQDAQRPFSCQPDAPGGWEFDPATNYWKQMK